MQVTSYFVTSYNVIFIQLARTMAKTLVAVNYFHFRYEAGHEQTRMAGHKITCMPYINKSYIFLKMIQKL